MTFTPPKQLRDRIKKARDRGKLARFDYVQRSKNTDHDQVNCKGCGAALIHWRPYAQESRIIGGKTVIRERMIQAQTPVYTEIEITFDDGSKHFTSLCKSCAQSLKMDDLEDLYAADLNALLQDRGPKEYILGNVRSRAPVSFTIVRD